MTPTDPAHQNGDLDPQTIAELQRLARSRPKSGREAAAKASAIRTLERLSRERRRQEVPPMPGVRTRSFAWTVPITPVSQAGEPGGVVRLVKLTGR